MSKYTAIKIDGVGKEYRLGAIGGGTLRGDIQSWWARARGKEDPNTRIGDTASARRGERFWALRDVSFDVKKGEALGIIGHNGAGKSTLLKLISRVTAPTEGTISFDGRIASMLEVGTGFHQELTGRENVYMNGAILGMTKKEIDRKLDEIIAFAEMQQFIDTPVKRYSSGMYVKLAFSVAAHLDSEIMLMDEVLAVGDMKFQQKCLGKMGDAANAQGKTILYVSHNMNTIRQLCSRCVVLDHGHVVFNGGVEQAIDLYSDMNRSAEPYIDDFSARRSKWLQNQRMRVVYSEYADNNSVCFNSNASVGVRIRWINTAEVRDAALRIEVSAIDNTAVATAMIAPFYSGAQGETGEAVFRLDISSLAEGDYLLKYVFFSINEFGTASNLDIVTGLHLKKTVPAEGFTVMWAPTAWGRVRLPDMTAELSQF